MGVATGLLLFFIFPGTYISSAFILAYKGVPLGLSLAMSVLSTFVTTIIGALLFVMTAGVSQTSSSSLGGFFIIFSFGLAWAGSIWYILKRT